MKEQYINQYSIAKTLRFSMIPEGKTEENFENKLLLEIDEKRAEEYIKVKKLIDRYHKSYIDSVLSGLILDGIEEYSAVYYKKNKDDNDTKFLEDREAYFRKTVSGALKNNETYKSILNKEMIRNILPEYLSDEEERKSVEMFYDFTTYFKGFFENRENMYSEESQTTAIGYRCINENLPRFLDNAASYAKVIVALPESTIKQLNEDMFGIYGVYVENIFSVDYFSMVLSQSGIDKYNGIIGGYTCNDGTKVKGLNEYINLYNQLTGGKDKSLRLPLIKPLYKQILSDRETISFIPEKYEDDNDVLSSIDKFNTKVINGVLDSLSILFSELPSYNPNGIYVKSGLPVTNISNDVFDSWDVISNAWNRQYEEKNPLKSGKNAEKYYDDEKKAFKKISSFSIADLQKLGSETSEGNIIEYYVSTVANRINAIKESYLNAKPLLTSEYKERKKLCSNTEAIDLIKTYLDDIKDLELLVKPLMGTGKEENKDEVFYGKFVSVYEELSSVDELYDKVRNYLTQKPYSKDKIKLNFDNPQLLGGWDKNKEKDYRTVLLRKDKNYYVAIMDKSNNKIFVNPPKSKDGEESYEKMEYKLLPGPNKMLPKVFFAKSNIETYAPSKEILAIRDKESFKKGKNFNIDDCHKFIDFYKSSIEINPDWSQFGFKFSPTESYKDISEFYREVADQGYTIKFNNIPCAYIDKFVDTGELYLFRLYNKDFSEYSKGTPNLHTLFFKALFDEKNLSNVVFKLNGESEMFYRKASIKNSEKIVHPANQPIDNKNPDNNKKQSLFEYDLIKDKRFTRRQFSIHIPITLNFKAHGSEFINYDVRKVLKETEQPYVIGIDRGERNLIYISVINSNGEIVEQKSLNEIIGDNGYSVDYQKLLERKEKERDEARKSWGTIENIKELKEGYLSLVVHQICELVMKYDAVIAMEDLNFGFKRGRFNVERQVYQKFENMLISKLNFLCDKKAEPDSEGGLLKAYQLTNKYDGVNKGKQNGIIFYVPAWLTSKIDPVTGFSDLLHPKYESVKESLELFGKLDDIRYNADSDIFEFDIDYDKYPKCNADYKKKWTICSNGDRILTYRNPEKNSEWDNKRIILTEEFKKLFDNYEIDYSTNLQKAIVSKSEKDFFIRLTKLFALTLQMRNSITGSTDPMDDYLISPVRNENGEFYDSRICSKSLPTDADANGAYNIARKGLWAISVLKDTPNDKLDKADLSISNAKWLEYAQK